MKLEILNARNNHAKDLWSYLQSTDKKILMYGMGNGADKILNICEGYGIEVCDFFASDGFVRGHMFHGKRVLSYSEACEKYGRENMIVLLSFASSLPAVTGVPAVCGRPRCLRSTASIICTTPRLPVTAACFTAV